MSKIKNTIKAVNLYVKKTLSPYRYTHSVNVAKTARKIAQQYGLSKKNCRRAYLAGLSHDMCKEMKDTELLKTAARDGFPISAFEQHTPNILHGRAAAVLLAEKFNVTDERILSAVREHTIGSDNPRKISKIIMIADKIEPGRPQAEKMQKKIKGLSLNETLHAVIFEVNNHLEKKGEAMHPKTKKMYKALSKRLHRGSRP